MSESTKKRTPDPAVAQVATLARDVRDATKRVEAARAATRKAQKREYDAHQAYQDLLASVPEAMREYLASTVGLKRPGTAAD